jgi:hypothetical protein
MSLAADVVFVAMFFYSPFGGSHEPGRPLATNGEDATHGVFAEIQDPRPIRAARDTPQRERSEFSRLSSGSQKANQKHGQETLLGWLSRHTRLVLNRGERYTITRRKANDHAESHIADGTTSRDADMLYS